MYEFARASNAVLIAGHTHKPIFESIAYAAKLEAEIAAEREKLGKTSDPGIRKEIQEQIQDLSARLEWERAQAKGISSGMPECPACPEPIVFNTGCCSFSDGDITGIEIEGNTIRLVRWPDDQGNPKKKVLEEADLLQIL